MPDDSYLEEAEGPKFVSFSGRNWNERHPISVCQSVYDGHPVRLFVIDEGADLQACCSELHDICPSLNSDTHKWISVSDFLELHPETKKLPRVSPCQLVQRSDETSDWTLLVHEFYENSCEDWEPPR